MSNAEQIADIVIVAHRQNYGVRGWSCACGHKYIGGFNLDLEIQDHKITEAVKAGIEAQLDERRDS